ncbi:hypothetical protein XaC1_134 [Xanthomonas phage XaC1]|nr:hypothetical protein XaC1_134 [Xanthomonas phage XaC1]
MYKLTHSDVLRMIENKNPHHLFDYINAKVLPDSNNKILLSHLRETINLRNSVTYFGIFIPVENIMDLKAPKVFNLLDDGTILHNSYSTTMVRESHYFDPEDKGTQFNFNFMFPELGISLDEINKLLVFLKHVQVNIFCTYETKNK